MAVVQEDSPNCDYENVDNWNYILTTQTGMTLDGCLALCMASSSCKYMTYFDTDCWQFYTCNGESGEKKYSKLQKICAGNNIIFLWEGLENVFIYHLQ